MRLLIVFVFVFSSVVNAGQVAVVPNLKVAGKTITNFTNFKALVCTTAAGATNCRNTPDLGFPLIPQYRVPNGKQFRIIAMTANADSETLNSGIAIGHYWSVLSNAGTISGPPFGVYFSAWPVNTLDGKQFRTNSVTYNNPRQEWLLPNWIVPATRYPFVHAVSTSYLTTITLYGYEEDAP